MNERRLTILREFLQNEVPADRYLQKGYGYFEDNVLVSACALGWATQCTTFQSEGLIDGKFDHLVWPVYQDIRSPYQAAKAFFDITSTQCDHIFSVHANYESTNKFETIRHIDEVLSGEIV